MRITKQVPAEELYIALLDDDPRCSCRSPYIYSCLRDYKQLAEDKYFLITDNIKKFISFADKHRTALLFCDPGALGQSELNEWDQPEDNLMARWLEDRPSRILYIPWLVTPSYYSFRTFELKHQVKLFGTEFQWHINQIFYEWFFEYNPLALFIDEFALDCAHAGYIKKLKEPVLSQVCVRFGVSGRTIADRKKAIIDYYNKIWKEAMRKRGIKI
jgi:hypothetical protein